MALSILGNTVLMALKSVASVASPDQFALHSQESHSLDLDSLLTSNNIPLEGDIPPIHDFLSAAQSRLSSLDFQIETLRGELVQLVLRREEIAEDTQYIVASHDSQINTRRDTLAQIECRRKETAESVRQYRSILAPIRRVPSELLCEIFAITASNERVAQTTDKFLKSPWRLSAVCRFWRISALTYPPLWSFITVTTFDFASERTVLLPMLKSQLHRSATASLDIYCRVSHLHPPLLDPVCAESDRWTILRLRLVSPSYRGDDPLEWLRPLTGRFSRLETLEAFGVSAQIPDAFSESSAPCLTRVILTDAKFKYRSPSVTLPWKQITHYRGAYDKVRHCEILKATPMLLECTIGIMSVDTSVLGDNHATLNHLRRLALEYATFLDHLTAPLLEDLLLMYTWSSQLPPLLHFLDRSPGLNRLTLLQCATTPKLTTILRTLQTLTYLFIEPETYPDDASDQTALFHALTLADPSTDICPLLTSLVYGVGLQFPREDFFSMARSRFRAGTLRRLASLRIFSCGYQAGCPQDVLVDVGMLQEEGFDVAFMQSNDPRLQKAKSDFY